MMNMKKRTSLFLVPFVLCTMGAWALFFAGCSREEAPVSPSPSAAKPASAMMDDPAFRAKLADLRAERSEVVKARHKVVEQMKAKVDAAKARLKTDDEKLVKAELEKDPEWISLCKRCTDANEALDEQRQKALGAVREKMTEKISK